MGKRQIGDMQPNELVVTLLISELAAISLQDMGQPLILSFVAMALLVFLEIAISIITMKSPKVKSFLGGNPVVIIDGGVVLQKAMKEVRMSLSDLTQLLRNQGIFDLSEVQYAVLEVNGNLSVQLKSQYMPLCEEKNQNSLPLLVISEGKIVLSALNFLNITQEALFQIIKRKKVDINDIYFMTLTRGGETQIIKKENKI